MTIKEILTETFEDYAKAPYSKKVYGIYKNPTSNELRDLIKEEKPISFRVLIDKKKKDIYVFNSDLLHAEAAKKIFGFTSVGKRDRFHHGIANKAGTLRKRTFLNDADIKEVADWLKPPMKMES
ncbi:MAG: hypothetical protein DRQ78_11425 [Epsilonproteobacteria bacterium]|nr:MAG: hypothetical protein DRQ78_11425 [Campylobacterota bacterium]RLD64483.1 MAG: hypothetical protein DRJ01_00655 [Bacteroidota bacterium]